MRILNSFSISLDMLFKSIVSNSKADKTDFTYSDSFKIEFIYIADTFMKKSFPSAFYTNDVTFAGFSLW